MCKTNTTPLSSIVLEKRQKLETHCYISVNPTFSLPAGLPSRVWVSWSEHVKPDMPLLLWEKNKKLRSRKGASLININIPIGLSRPLAAVLSAWLECRQRKTMSPDLWHPFRSEEWRVVLWSNAFFRLKTLFFPFEMTLKAFVFLVFLTGSASGYPGGKRVKGDGACLNPQWTKMEPIKRDMELLSNSMATYAHIKGKIVAGL